MNKLFSIFFPVVLKQNMLKGIKNRILSIVYLNLGSSFQNKILFFMEGINKITKLELFT